MLNYKNSNYDLFGKLLRKDTQEPFSRHVIDNWYLARQFVFEHFYPLKVDRITPLDKKYVHVIFDSLTDSTIAVARQIALLIHFPNFDEKSGENRSVITFLNQDIRNDEYFDNLISKLSKEEYFSNLFTLCKYSAFISDSFVSDIIRNPNSFIDIEIQFINENIEQNNYDNSEIVFCIKSSDVEDYFTNTPINRSINVYKAMFTNMVYSVGTDIDNLSIDEANDIEKYDSALQFFCYQQEKKDIKKNWFGLVSDKSTYREHQIDLKNKLSTVFCADCFESHIHSVCQDYDKYILDNSIKSQLHLVSAIKKYIKEFARCEHNRWNAEKLIMGFRQLSDAERFEDESLFVNEKKRFRKMLKNRASDPAHIDICSYHDLRRIDPGSIKYDYLLMMSIPKILSVTLNRKIKL